MIFTIADIIVCGLGVVLGTIFEYWQAGKLERQSGLLVKKKITVAYMLVALVVCILRMVIEMKLAGSEPNWKLYATCVLQGSVCGVYISMVMLFYIGSKYEEKTKGGKGILGRATGADPIAMKGPGVKTMKLSLCAFWSGACAASLCGGR